MEFELAPYNALIKIHVPHEAAPDVVTALEREMLPTLATKSDLAAHRDLIEARLNHLEGKLGHLEARMTIRLGGLLAAGIGLIATLPVLLRH